MADRDREWLGPLLTCPVCQDIFKDPRQLPCGHSMCMTCLESMAEHPEFPFRCPDCRGYFGPVVGVQKSYTLASIAEDFRINSVRKNKQENNVYCDLCTDSKTLAKKTCLKCEVSLCQYHVKDHQELPVFTGHPLVSPLGDLLERKCPQHEDKVLRYYCKTTNSYICNLCALETKKMNEATEAVTVLRRQLTDNMDQNVKRLGDRIKESTDLVKKVKKVMDSERRNRADSPINSVTVVLLFLWLIVLYYTYNFSVENHALTEALDKQQSRLNHIYSSLLDLVQDQHTKSKYKQETGAEGALLLDLDSASPLLGLSNDLRTAERLKDRLSYPKNDKRFDGTPQVLTARCFSTGAHIWEVEAEGYWDIAVSYKSIWRKSKSGTFGNNSDSWSLTHNGKGKLFAYHDGERTVVSTALQSSRIAVMVDIEKGNITFGAVETSIKHLHEFRAKLTNPVCLGFGLYLKDSPGRASIVKVS